jgi:exosortase E/protease (VPEID-CTERM system)
VTPAVPQRRRQWRPWLAVGSLLLVEYLLISLRFDAYSLRSYGGAWGALGYVGAFAPAGVVIAASLWLFRRQAVSPVASGELGALPALAPVPEAPRPRWSLLAIHALLVAGFFALTGHIFGGGPAAGSAALWFILWSALGAFCAFTLTVAFVDLSEVRRWAWSGVHLLALAVGAIAWLAGNWTVEFWIPLSRATLGVVAALLRPFFADVVSDPAALSLALGGFKVTIAPQCSGFEGMGLITVLTVAFIAVRRRGLRFPRALLLLPVAIIAAWVGNALRIAGLMVVGATLDPELAYEAFHSKAGWVAFCAIALSIAAVAERHSFFRRAPSAELEVELETENPSAACLLPCLLLLGSALVTGMFAREIDWFYPLRVVGPLLALYLLRKNYADLLRNAAPARPVLALAVGAAVGIAWYLTDPLDPEVDRAVGHALASSPAGFGVWLGFRVVGAVLVVPICEELAFRGFLLRWLVNRDFTAVSFRTATPWAVLISSAAFALVHERWLAGALAGAAYALVQVRTGRLSDAIVAHAGSNALIAIWAIASGEWSHWV